MQGLEETFTISIEGKSAIYISDTLLVGVRSGCHSVPITNESVHFLVEIRIYWVLQRSLSRQSRYVHYLGKKIGINKIHTGTMLSSFSTW